MLYHINACLELVKIKKLDNRKLDELDNNNFNFITCSIIHVPIFIASFYSAHLIFCCFTVSRFPLFLHENRRGFAVAFTAPTTLPIWGIF